MTKTEDNGDIPPVARIFSKTSSFPGRWIGRFLSRTRSVLPGWKTAPSMVFGMVMEVAIIRI